MTAIVAILDKPGHDLLCQGWWISIDAITKREQFVHPLIGDYHIAQSQCWKQSLVEGAEQKDRVGARHSLQGRKRAAHEAKFAVVIVFDQDCPLLAQSQQSETAIERQGCPEPELVRWGEVDSFGIRA